MNLFRRQPQKVRTFRMEGQITDEMANQCIAMLLFWKMEDPKLPGRIEIDSPGGSVTATLAILDTMDFVGFPVHTHCPAYACGCAALILGRGARGFRGAGREATIGMCPTKGGVANFAGDPEQVVKMMMKLRNRILDEFHIATGRTREEIEEAQEQERAFSAEEALAYGLIDQVC